MERSFQLTSQFNLAKLSCGFFATVLMITSATSGTLNDGRIAIIHASKSTILDDHLHSRGSINGKPKLLQQLHDSGVQVIGRYLARCFQDALPTKMLIRGGTAGELSERDAIFKAGIAIASIYQYRGGDDDGYEKFTKGFPNGAISCEQTPSLNAIEQRRRSGTWDPKDEATLDAEAAVAQAHRLKQPPDSAIYFGIDYEYNATPAEKAGIIAYFREARTILARPENNYRIGAYGNGAVLRLLSGDEPQTTTRIVDFTWISPSRSYPGSSEFHSSGHWNIAQAQSDNLVMFTNDGTCFEYEYDADVQNAKRDIDDVGFWFRTKPFHIERDRTDPIYGQRRFICSISEVKQGAKLEHCGGPAQEPQQCDSDRACILRTVRLTPGNPRDAYATIDFWDYGGARNVVPSKRLTRSFSVKPLYRAAERNAAKCTCFGSNESQPCDARFQ